MFSKPFKLKLPTRDQALPGRAQPMRVPAAHFVNGAPLDPRDSHLREALFGLGCFWGAEKMFWQTPGVVSSSVGYAGGFTPNPTYEEVCSGATGHAEVVRVFFDPARVSYDDLLRVFWEGHDPTQGMRQGGDVGTQYRSAIYYFDEEQRKAAEASRDAYQRELTRAGYGTISTEITPAPTFYFAEDYHQQYLAKNPHGYCGHGGTGVTCPIGVVQSSKFNVQS
jgi:peptide-methionine (S)-S-oxide reductase